MGIIRDESSSERYFYLDNTWYNEETEFTFNTLLNSLDADNWRQCQPEPDDSGYSSTSSTWMPTRKDKVYPRDPGLYDKFNGPTLVFICGGVMCVVGVSLASILIFRTNIPKMAISKLKRIASLIRKEMINAHKLTSYISGSRKSHSVRSSTGTHRAGHYPLSPSFTANFPADFEAYAGLLDVCPNTLALSVKILGKGEYGTVHKALAETLPFVSNGPIIVAVKSINNPHNQLHQNIFAEEVKMMMKAGRHLNIVNILGIVRVGRPLLIMEYCQLGSLLFYVRSRKDDGLIYNHVDEDGSLRPLDENEMKHQWLSVCERNETYDPASTNMRRQMLATADLIRISHQISRGMEYLASREIIHRDLAARNVLLTDKLIAKISDFGLAKHGGQSYTISNGLIALPILWMPPDTIISRQFSEKSDVWSFGVTLWETFSMGQVPFDQPNVTKFSAASFAEWLLEGHQMNRPDSAPSLVYSLMKSCWQLQADDRPAFSDVCKELDLIVSRANSDCEYLPLEDNLD